jgi:Predicted membrane protein
MIDRARQLLTKLDRWSGRHRTTRVGKRAVLGFMRHEALQYAGSMAYFGILSIFQLLVLGVVSFSFFLGAGGARDFVLNQVRLNTPIDADAMAKVIDNVIQSRGGISIIGLVLLVWSALGIFSTLSRGVSRAFDAAQPRPFIQDKLLGLALMAVTGILGIAAVLIGFVSGVVQQMTRDVIARVPGGEVALYLVGLLLPLLLVFMALLVLYRLVPNRPDVRVADVWPGALAAAILWSVLRFGFTYYATRVAHYDSAFGPISTGISLLVFLYFASIALLLGAEVARANLVDAIDHHVDARYN